MIRPHCVFLLLIILFGCQKETIDYPVVFTGNVINITDTSATLVAKVSNLGNSPILESGFIWDIHPSYKNGLKLINPDTNKGVYELSTNLKLLPGKTYYARSFIRTSETVCYGQEIQFNTKEKPENKGSWTMVYDSNLDGGFEEFINTTFTLGNITYVIMEDGTLYRYSHLNNTFEYVCKNLILAYSKIALIHNNKVYLFSYDSLYLFDPVNQLFNRISTLGKNLYFPSGFLIDDEIYIGLGLDQNQVYTKEFWCYNIANNTWKSIASFPGDYRANAFGITIGKKGYVGAGYNLIAVQYPYPKFKDMWCYDPGKDQWTQKETIPVSSNNLFDNYCTVLNDAAFYSRGKVFYRYNSTFDIWEEMSQLNTNYYLFSVVLFQYKGKVFFLKCNSYMDNKYFRMWSYEN